MKLILLVWVVGLIGCLIMKKIQPEGFKLYLGYTTAVCVIATVVLTMLAKQG